MILNSQYKDKKYYEVFIPQEHDDLILYEGHNRKKAFDIAKKQKWTTFIEVFDYQLEQYPDFSRYETGERIEYYEVTDGVITDINY